MTKRSQRRRRRHAKGYCWNCARMALSGMARCDLCLLKNRTYMRHVRSAQSERWRGLDALRGQRLRARRAAQGFCIDNCGRPAAPERVRCEICLRAQVEIMTTCRSMALYRQEAR